MQKNSLVKPGDHLIITVTNNTTKQPVEVTINPPNCGPGGSQMTTSSLNIHYHGTNTSPTFHSDEVIKAQTRFTELQFQLQNAMEWPVNLLKQNPADETQVMAQLDKVLNAEDEVKRTQIALMVRIKTKLTRGQQARLRHLRGKSTSE